MNITQTQIDDLNATLKVQLDKDDYATRVNDALKEYQKKAVIDGFRKGKTPFGIIRKMYGKAVLIEEINKLIGEGLTKYIQDNTLNLLGEPLPNETEGQDLNLDQENFEFTYDIALAPVMNVKLSKREKVPYYTIKIDDEMIDKQVESICKNSGSLEVVDVVEGTEYLKGELIELDENGKPKEGGIRNEDASVSVYHMKDEEARNAFIGAKAGSEVIFNPARAYPNKTDFAAMLGVSKEEAEKVKSDFCLIVSEIKRYVDAEVNQALFDKLYGEGAVKSVEEFRAKVKEDLGNQFKGHSEYRFSVDARDKMLKKNEDVVLPEAFLKRWMVATNREMTPESVEKDFDSYREEFKWQLIKTAMVKEYEIKVEDEDMKGMAREIAAAQLQQYGLYGLTNEQLDGFAVRLLEDQKQRANMYERALENKIFATVKEGVKLEEQLVTMDEFGKLFEK
ncbi:MULTISPECIES: trigger factor [Sanguibacteroides]|uniref:Trigger factor n=1 Tax=Sanguibacteroides justesenii TaxID=1547597 RepID=A0A0C3R5J2_9PORP|nr:MULTISPECIES: trigger factor [Sanguibacteroides]KIO43239.1 trigger factor [Sanguibacteroides justesenii]KIO44955.1 trigger factor [Sanguibacteroides justesenii]PXZ43174.1 trigger factor [Sanguibacteroides justesenii]